MGSKIPTRDPLFKNKIITDLDELSDDKKLDNDSRASAPNFARNKLLSKPQRDMKLKSHFKSGINTTTAPATRRAKSSEGFRITDKRNVRQLLEIKDEQIEQLVEKLSSVIEFNGQFGRENDRLVEERQRLVAEIEALRRRIHENEQRECEECTRTKEALSSSQSEYDKCAKDNAELRNDVKMMKVLVYRLNVQIERYQECLRKTKPKVDDSVYKVDYEDGPDTFTISSGGWGALNTNILAPLLNAYEEMVHEKTDIVQQFEQDMSEFTGKLRKTLEENERLQKSLDDMRRGSESWIEEKTRLQAQVDLYRSKAEVQGKRADLAKEKLVEVLRVYEQKVQAQALDIERLQEAYSRSRGELTTLRGLQQKPDAVVESLRECQKLFEDLKLHHNSEKQKASEDLTNLNLRLEQQRDELLTVKSENRDLKARLEKETEQLTILNDKYSGLKQNIRRIRQSKELLRNRLKAVIDWGKGLEEGKVKVQTTWNDIAQLETLLAQKELQMQALLARHQAEMDDLKRKLRNREDSLKKILRERAERKSSAGSEKKK